MTGRFDMTPWAAQVIPDADRDAIRQRVPAGYVLRVSATYRTLHVRLVDPRVGFISEADGPYPWAIERALVEAGVA